MPFERTAILAATLAATWAAAGCGVPYVRPADARESAYEEDVVTGSNMPRHRSAGAPQVRQADKDALASEIRNPPRNTGQ